MNREHRNLGDADFEFETYDDYLDDRLDSFFGRERVSSISHSWEFVHDAKTLFEDGEFGRLCSVLDRQPSRAKWEHMKHADCLRCGEPEVGVIGVMGATETPSGEIVSVGMHSELCEDCFDQVLDELEETGAIQPTLTTGEWWPGDDPFAEAGV